MVDAGSKTVDNEGKVEQLAAAVTTCLLTERPKL